MMGFWYSKPALTPMGPIFAWWNKLVRDPWIGIWYVSMGVSHGSFGFQTVTLGSNRGIWILRCWVLISRTITCNIQTNQNIHSFVLALGQFSLRLKLGLLSDLFCDFNLSPIFFLFIHSIHMFRMLSI